MQANFSIVEVENNLHKWGQWSKKNGIKLDYPSKTTFAENKAQSEIDISDELAQKIDESISNLKLFENKLHEFAVLRFVEGKSLTSCGRVMKTSQKTADKYKAAVIAFVAGSLHSEKNLAGIVD